MFPPPPAGYGVRNAFTSPWTRPVAKEVEQPKMFDVYLRAGDEKSAKEAEDELWDDVHVQCSGSHMVLFRKHTRCVFQTLCFPQKYRQK